MKAGIDPLNPGVIDDNLLCPSRAFEPKPSTFATSPNMDPLLTSLSSSSSLSDKSAEGHLFSPEKQMLFENAIKRGMMCQMWNTT